MIRFLAFFIGLVISTSTIFAADMRFVQVDSAMFSTKTKPKFQKLIKDINKQKNVEFVIFSGNNTEKPDVKLLEQFLDEAKKLNCPFYIALGSKDVNKQKHLSKKYYTEILKKNTKQFKRIDSTNYSFIKNNWAFIVVDGSKEVIPSSMGYYKAEVLDWLNIELNKYQKKNVVILQHFPLIPPAQKESKYTYNPEKYLQLLTHFPNVKAIIAGNFNTNSEKTYNGILHITTADAPTYRIIDILDYETDQPIFWSTIRK